MASDPPMIPEPCLNCDSRNVATEQTSRRVTPSSTYHGGGPEHPPEVHRTFRCVCRDCGYRYRGRDVFQEH